LADVSQRLSKQYGRQVFALLSWVNFGVDKMDLAWSELIVH
jgi:hypothetical protein